MNQLSIRDANGQTNRELALNIIDTASGFQQKASDTRLGLPRAPNSGLVKARSASANILKERREKKEAHGKVTIKLSAGLWMLPVPNANKIRGKMQAVC